MPGNHKPLYIQPVSTRAQWRDFFQLADRIQRHDPNWVSPLLHERRRQWDQHHPWFAHARARAWLAMRGDQAVGSISAQIDDLQEQTWDERVGYFGQLEGIDDPGVFRELLATAAAWLRAEGMDSMRGPYDLSPNQTCGLLVEGYETPPMIMMGHAPAYYARHVEHAGLQAAATLVAYFGPTAIPPPAPVQKLLARYRRRLQVRTLDRSQFTSELRVMADIFNDAWARNWGFVPFTDAEFARVGKDMKPLLRPWSIQIAELDGEPAAFMVTLPNLNEALQGLHGRLLPLGWARLASRLLRGRFDSARVPLMGVRQRYQGSASGAVLAYAIVEATRVALQADNIQSVELSWILEQNTGVRAIIESMGPRVYKRYRIYERSLAQD